MGLIVNAQKTDTLYHTNGNVLTGEVKKYTKGLLYFKMDGMGTLKVENEEIMSLKSHKFMRILTRNGGIYYGDIDTSSVWGEVKVGLLTERTVIKVNDIIEIFPINNSFFLRLSGRMDFGIDYSKSTNLLRVNASGEVNYQKEKWAGKIKNSSIETWQLLDSILYTSKTDFVISADYLLSADWRVTANTGINTNSEMGLKSRFYGGFYVQRYLFQTNKQFMYMHLGLVANMETNTEYVKSTNIEGVFGFDYDVFKYKSPAISLNTFVDVFPNLITNGRWRLNSGFDTRIEVFSDFYVGIKVYYQYDSMPISLNANDNDWGFNFSIGYSFN